MGATTRASMTAVFRLIIVLGEWAVCYVLGQRFARRCYKLIHAERLAAR